MLLRAQRNIIYSILLIGVICVFIVVLTAYATELRVENNRLIEEIEVLQGEVDTLNVEIKQANNIERIESVAIQQLGMVYPDSDQCVYLSQEESPAGSLAMVIRENAYN
ncbi:MAG: cell division protein FtsL [Firmicutes bacterium]|nr:cell division protein FtsL [Bacillota bacterium]